MTKYEDWFARITGDRPYPWQAALGVDQSCADRVLEVAGDGAVTARRPSGFKLPELKDLRAAMPAAVTACASLFAGDKGVTTVEFRA